MPSSAKLAADRLEQEFEDKKPPLTATEATVEASRCLYCYDAPCIRACPTAIDIPTFIRKIGTGNLRGAARTILTSNLLGASCARVCPVEVLCEGDCVYNEDGRTPVAIGRLQRHAMDRARSADLFEKAPASGKSVGLVGAGPASLACGGMLALLGHEAVLYERNPWAGGLNTTGVAPYKMLADESISEVEFIESLGVKILTGITVGDNEGGGEIPPKQLLEQHDALFLGLGLGPDSKLGVPGEEGPGVTGAVAWIEQMKTDPSASVEGVGHALVVGAGNTAVDAARELTGLGVRVTMIVRRGAESMRAYAHELAPAKQDGVGIVDHAAVAEVYRDGDQVRGVRLVATEDGKPTDIPLGELMTNLVVVAIGQSKLARLATSFPGVTCDERGRIVADPSTGVTGNPRIFTGGDALNGGKEVVNAAHDGHLAARSIDRLLRLGTMSAPGALRATSIPKLVPERSRA